jgi:transposase-like protein
MKSSLLRADTKGRVRTPRERREQLLDEFEQTGASAAMFAKIAGLRYSTFAAWVNRRRKQQASAGAPSGAGEALVQFVEAAVEPKAPRRAGTLRIALPGGAQVEIGSSDEVMLVAELLQALERKAGREVSC